MEISDLVLNTLLTLPQEKKDVFTVVAGLSTTSIQLMSAASAPDEDEFKKMVDQTKDISDALLRKIQALQIEYQYGFIASLLAVTQVMGAMTQICSDRRDANIKLMLEHAIASPQES